MSEPTTQSIESVARKLLHVCDGPLTPFVAISRATREVASGTDPTVAANALYEALSELGVTGLDSLVPTDS